MSIHSLLRTTERAAPEAAVGLPLLDAATKPPLEVGETADCCCANAQVRVVLPPVAGVTPRPELRLCAHHYRKATAALAKAGADIYDAQGRSLTDRDDFWADSPTNRSPAGILTT